MECHYIWEASLMTENHGSNWPLRAAGPHPSQKNDTNLLASANHATSQRRCDLGFQVIHIYSHFTCDSFESAYTWGDHAVQQANWVTLGHGPRIIPLLHDGH